MKVREGLTKASESDKVDAYMNNLKHPLAEVAKALREIILKTDPEIGEEIKWNAPAFFCSGELPPFNPREHKRHNRCIQLLQAGLHSPSIPERGKNEGQFWFAGGRLSRRAQIGRVSRHGRCRIPKGNLGASRQGVARHPGRKLKQSGFCRLPAKASYSVCSSIRIFAAVFFRPCLTANVISPCLRYDLTSIGCPGEVSS
ncbi:MAG: DUF1801 domain-containing protein [Acidobacteria bacterium]|nr:DUF1801 domain-containing protein [Acidobacteriota bacterium]